MADRKATFSIPRAIAATALLVALTFAVGANGFVAPAGARSLGSQSLQADGKSPIVPNAQAGGITTAVAFHGDTAFMSLGARIIVLDTSNPTSPREIGRSEWLGPKTDLIRALAAHDGVLYAATDGDGLLVFDTSIPGSLSIIDRPSPDNDYTKLVVHQDLLLAASRSVGGTSSDWLHVYDLSDPSAPVAAGRVHTEGSANSIYARGDYAYLGLPNSGPRGPGGVAVVDLGEPGKPLLLGFLAVHGGKMTGAGSLGIVARNSGVDLIDLDSADPLMPEKIGRIELDVTRDLNVVSVVTDGEQLVLSMVDTPAEEYVLGLTLPTLELFDISAPGAPIHVSTVGHPSNDRDWWIDIHRVGDHIFAGSDNGGLFAFDYSDVSAPRVVSHFDPIGYIEDIVIQGDYAYLADSGSGLRIVDLSSGAWPPPTVGLVNTPINAYSLIVDGGYAFVSNWLGPLSIIDVRDPTAPRMVGTIDESMAYSMAVDGPLLYLGLYDFEEAFLAVYDVADPSAPLALGKTPIESRNGPWAIATRGGFAYSLDPKLGVQLIDARDPTDPRVVSRFADQGRVTDMEIHGDRLIVTTPGQVDDELYRIPARLYDISDPGRPSELTPVRTKGPIDGSYGTSKLTIHENTAWFVGDRIEAIDLSDPERAVSMGTVELATWIGGPAVSERHVFGITQYSGLVRFDRPLGLDSDAPTATATIAPTLTQVPFRTRTPRPTEVIEPTPAAPEAAFLPWAQR